MASQKSSFLSWLSKEWAVVTSSVRPAKSVKSVKTKVIKKVVKAKKKTK